MTLGTLGSFSFFFLFFFFCHSTCPRMPPLPKEGSILTAPVGRDVGWVVWGLDFKVPMPFLYMNRNDREDRVLSVP